MREILFRGKREDNGKWVDGSLLIFPDNGDCYICVDIDGMCSLFKFAVESATVGQYTGMMDKNGKRIFEGDIITYDLDVGITLYAMCTFHKGSFGAKWIQEKVPVFDEFAHFSSYKDFKFEVIGNVWDNPELLEAGKL